MQNVTSWGLLALVSGLLVIAASQTERGSESMAEEARGPHLAHMVYFTLKDGTPEARQKLVDACKKYLTNHPGTVYFGAGARVGDLDREVNDQGFDVSLNLVFESRKAHDTYQTAPRHLQFIEENKATWAKVRVFDSYLD